jgi:hypothetical protein
MGEMLEQGSTNSGGAIAVAAPASAPDWGEIRRDVVCPLCDYNLRGLGEPRCPECGHRFVWSEVLDPNRLHPWLFEHHPQRNVWSFLRTMIGGLRPGRFWQSVSPAMVPKVGRLRWYVAFWVVLSLAGFVGAWVYGTVATYREYMTMGGRGDEPGLVLRGSIREAWEQNPYVGAVFWTTAFLLAWPMVTYFSLMIFRISMRKAKVKPVHVLRCVAYVGDSALWYGAVTAAVSLGFMLLGGAGWNWEQIQWLMTISFFTCCATVIVFAWRLCQAYRKYLRFDHAIATVIAAEIVGLLTIMVAVAIWNDRRVW